MAASPAAVHLRWAEPFIYHAASLVSRKENGSDSKAKDNQGIGIVSFLTAVSVSVIIFAVQVFFFIILRNKLARIL